MLELFTTLRPQANLELFTNSGGTKKSPSEVFTWNDVLPDKGVFLDGLHGGKSGPVCLAEVVRIQVGLYGTIVHIVVSVVLVHIARRGLTGASSGEGS